jgi:hypothetical protein
VEVFRCQDKDGITVVCSKDTWDGHIVAEHLEMKGCEAIVQATIERPFKVYQDKTHLRRRVLYRPFVLPKPFQTQYLRVIVEYRTRRFRNQRGYVVTAFACTDLRQGDVLLWEE